ncbi:MAG: EutN/CcmL family microcompartment protein [Myxococcales bacterium]|nr:EutN/CcmL family microcompartment protein [Myxococcales bacterium]
MILAQVIGTVVSTIKNPAFAGHKLLLCQPLDPAGQPNGAQRVAVDRVHAGIGDRVLLLDEGNGTRQILGGDAAGPIRTLVVGVVDAVELST